MIWAEKLNSYEPDDSTESLSFLPKVQKDVTAFKYVRDWHDDSHILYSFNGVSNLLRQPKKTLVFHISKSTNELKMLATLKNEFKVKNVWILCLYCVSYVYKSGNFSLQTLYDLTVSVSVTLVICFMISSHAAWLLTLLSQQQCTW